MNRTVTAPPPLTATPPLLQEVFNNYTQFSIHKKMSTVEPFPITLNPTQQRKSNKHISRYYQKEETEEAESIQ